MPKIAYIQPLYHVPNKVGRIDHIATEEDHKLNLKTACEDMLDNGRVIPPKISGVLE